MDPNKPSGYNFYYNRMDYPSNLSGQLSSNIPQTGINSSMPPNINPGLGQSLPPGSQQLTYANMLPLMYQGSPMLSLGMPPHLLYNPQLNGLSAPIYSQGQLANLNSSGLPQNSGSSQHMQPGQQSHLSSMIGSSGRPDLLSAQPDPRFAHAYLAGFGQTLAGAQPNFLYPQTHAMPQIMDYQSQQKNKDRDSSTKNYFKEKDARNQFAHEQNGQHTHRNLNSRDKDDRSHARLPPHGQHDNCTPI